MPGGDQAIREPWRMAAGYLAHHFGRDFLTWRIPFVQSLDASKTDVLLRMMERGVNSPRTSSCGRLFDAVSALVGIRGQVNYEAQAAIELEMSMADGVVEDAYPMDVVDRNETWIIDTKRTFEAIVADLQAGMPTSAMSQRFHNGLVAALEKVAELIRAATSIDRVCLSGGTFHNVYLLTHLQARLEQNGFQVFTHSEVPAGDGGLSLGQAMIAAHRVSTR
jgi:hydrogenase maturation protein HypF